MKQITRIRGKHLGTHYVFADYSEAIKYLTGPLSYLNQNHQDLTDFNCFSHWTFQNVKEKDWVTADDGKVIQVLKMYRMEARDKKRAYEVVCIKTVALMAYYYHYLRGERTGQCISRGCMNITDEALADSKARHTMGTNKHGRLGVKKVWKRMFVYYLVFYGSPVLAYKLTMQAKDRKSTLNLTYIHCQKEGYNLLKDPFVIRELESYMAIETFRERLDKALKRKFVDEERIVKELIEGLDAVRKGSMVHKQFIELATNMIRYSEERENIGLDGKAVARIEVAEGTNVFALPEPPKSLVKELDKDTIEVYNALVNNDVEEIEETSCEEVVDKIIKKEGEDDENS